MIVQVIIIAVLLVTINQRTEVKEVPLMRTNQFMQPEREIDEGYFCELVDWRWDK